MRELSRFFLNVRKGAIPTGTVQLPVLEQVEATLPTADSPVVPQGTCLRPDRANRWSHSRACEDRALQPGTQKLWGKLSLTPCLWLSCLSECDMAASKTMLNGLAPGSDGRDKGKAPEEQGPMSWEWLWMAQSTLGRRAMSIRLETSGTLLHLMCQRLLFSPDASPPGWWAFHCPGSEQGPVVRNDVWPWFQGQPFVSPVF